jgi:hypothetical protein
MENYLLSTFILDLLNLSVYHMESAEYCNVCINVCGGYVLVQVYSLPVSAQMRISTIFYR